MPSNDRRDWHRRLKAVEREYAVAVLAVHQFEAEVAAGQTRLPDLLALSDVRLTADRLPGTYLVRAFAVFEAALRSFWAGLGRNTQPPVSDLIDAIASRRRVPDGERLDAHAVREDRNRMVHLSGEAASAVEFGPACRRLHTFLSRLLDKW